MRSKICTCIGLAGAAISSAFGGWDAGLGTLVIFMAADYITGLAAAWAGRSAKTPGGGLDSRVGWIGLCKKGVTLLLVLIAHRLDMVLGLNYVREAVVIGFMVNELISLTENAGLLGVPVPKIIKDVLEVLKRNADEGDFQP